MHPMWSLILWRDKKVEAIKRDLKAWDILRDLCLNRSIWKAAIEVPEP